MIRKAIGTLAAVVLLVGVLSDQARAIAPVPTIEWVGGANGEWNNANAWRNTTTGVTGNALTLMGDRYGSEGMNDVNPAVTKARHIVIGGGATVDFAAETASNAMSPNSFRLRQGTTLTIKDGATWVSNVSDIPPQPSGAFECRCDPSSLILDGGTFRRTGTFSPAGGGNAIFNSYNDDNNQQRLGTKPPTTNIVITNGGRFENEGQLWFGTDGESSPNTRGTVTINNGHMDLTGGAAAPIMNGELPFVEADLAFFYDNSENVHPMGPRGPLNEEFKINFTGPGSITVDSGGILVFRQNEAGIWNSGATPSSYQDLWDMGILTAHGLSGKTGVTVPSAINDNNRARVAANFTDFFTVTGTPGTDDYKLTSITPPLQEVEYVGTNGGQWSDANAWKNVTTNATGNAATILGRANGSNGMNTVSLATTHARNITIPANTTVNYHGDMTGNLRMNQGSTLTIRKGAVWQQITDATYTENTWTEFDGQLILDGGTFRRSVAAPSQLNDGGGIMLLGSYRDDEAFEEIGGPAKVNVEIKNGGRLENSGQLWFGADDEQSLGLRVSVNINDGHIDLTGGTTPYTNSTLVVEADLAFFYDYYRDGIFDPSGTDPNGQPKNEEYEINFTGPGSITVDSSGIFVYRQNEFGIWSGGAAPVSYQDLWAAGILKANGLTGKVGITFGDNNMNAINLAQADFNTFFSVTGMPGEDDYKLTSLIEGPPVVVGVAGDYNNNGTVDAADYVLWRDGGNLQNDSSPGVQPEDYNVWRANFGKTLAPGGGSASSAAVPEPAAGLMLLVGMLLPFSLRRARAVV